MPRPSLSVFCGVFCHSPSLSFQTPPFLHAATLCDVNLALIAFPCAFSLCPLLVLCQFDAYYQQFSVPSRVSTRFCPPMTLCRWFGFLCLPWLRVNTLFFEPDYLSLSVLVEGHSQESLELKKKERASVRQQLLKKPGHVIPQNYIYTAWSRDWQLINIYIWLFNNTVNINTKTTTHANLTSAQT